MFRLVYRAIFRLVSKVVCKHNLTTIFSIANVTFHWFIPDIVTNSMASISGNFPHYEFCVLCDSPVGVATSHGINSPVFESREGRETVTFSKTFILTVSQPSLLFNRNRLCVPGYSGRGVYLTIYLHLVQEINNECSYISTAQMSLHGVDFVSWWPATVLRLLYRVAPMQVT